MINYREINKAFVHISREAIGDYLFRDGDLGEKTPLIFAKRVKLATRGYPYLTIDKLGTTSTKGYLTEVSSINSPYQEVYKSQRTILYQLTVYGSNEEYQLRASDIVEHLEGYFRLPRILDKFEEMCGANVVTTFDVEEVPAKVNAREDLEAAYFNISICAEDILVESEEDSHYFETVNIDAKGYRSSTDPAPLHITKTITGD